MPSGGLWLGSWLRFVAGNRLAPFVPTPHHICERMMALASVGPGDTLLDVGSGDGRLLLCAARRGARGLGYELDRRLVRDSRAAIDAAGFAAQLVVYEKDAAEADFAQASVVSLFVSDGGNAKLLPLLRKGAAKRRALGLAAARAVSFHFEIPTGSPPVATSSVDGTRIYLCAWPCTTERTTHIITTGHGCTDTPPFSRFPDFAAPVQTRSSLTTGDCALARDHFAGCVLLLH